MTSQKRILVVEDDPFISLDVTDSLKSFGYDVIGAVPSCSEAIEVALREIPDLMLMDINIQGEQDGIQVAEEIHKHKTIPVVFLTALADESTLQRARLVGPFGYLIKPFDPAELRSTIEIALDRADSSSQNPENNEDEEAIDELSAAAKLSGSAEEKVALLQATHAFDAFNSSSLAALASFGEIINVDGGKFIHLEEQQPDRAFLVLTGRVCIKKSTDSGKELILALLGPGDRFGLLYALPQFALVAAARAQLDSKIFAFPRALFSKMLSEIPEMMSLLMTEMMLRLEASYELSVSLAHSRVEARILATLSALLPAHSRAISTSGNERRIFITRKELADLTGTTPETAIRVTKQLERDGILDLARPGVIKIPDVEKLKNLR